MPFYSGSSAGSSQPWISDLKMDLESNGRTRWRLEFLLIFPFSGVGVTVNRVACTYEILRPLKAIKREAEALERLI